MFRFFLLFLFCINILLADELPKKTLYLSANIELAKNTKWEDIGVASEESFVEVIKNSWKAWAETHFKSFEVVDLGLPPKDAAQLHHGSKIIKWSSEIKKISDGNFELSAQYIVIGALHKDVLLSFDFPLQKLSVETADKKELSSKIASLVYNLLNSQTRKISALQDKVAQAGEETSVTIKITGNISLSEMSQLKNLLPETFKDLQLSCELKDFSLGSGTLLIRAKTTEEKLFLAFVQVGKLPLNEQKVLLFNQDDKSFAILSKEQNN